MDVRDFSIFYSCLPFFSFWYYCILHYTCKYLPIQHCTRLHINSNLSHRCLKPNDNNKPDEMNQMRLVQQLRYSGVLEVVKVARAGYPTRFKLKDFLRRFWVLCPPQQEKMNTILREKDLLRYGFVLITCYMQIQFTYNSIQIH